MLLESSSTEKCSTEPSPEKPNKSAGYAYNRKGQLVINGYSFVRASIRGGCQDAKIDWRCADARKFGCTARVRTTGKKLQPTHLTHTHTPRKQQQVDAIVWSEEMHSPTQDNVD